MLRNALPLQRRALLIRGLGCCERNRDPVSAEQREAKRCFASQGCTASGTRALRREFDFDLTEQKTARTFVRAVFILAFYLLA
jgi:hypothetical protein